MKAFIKTMFLEKSDKELICYVCSILTLSMLIYDIYGIIVIDEYKHTHNDIVT